MEETFSPTQDMTEYVGNGEKLLWEQDFSGNMDSYWRKWVGEISQKFLLKGIKASKEWTDFQTLKTNARAFQHFSYSSIISVELLRRFLT